MTLLTYATDPTKGGRAQFFAEAMYFGPRFSRDSTISRPFAAEFGVLGVGLLCDEYGGNIFVSVNSSILEHGLHIPAIELSNLREAIELVFPDQAMKWKDVVAVGTHVPEMQISSGDLLSATMNGTCGAAVVWGNNCTGFITAGHVAPNVGANVQGHNGRLIGSVVYSSVPGTSSSGADMSVVELVPGKPMPARFTGTANISAGQTPIDVHIRGNTLNANVISKNAWFYMPSMSGTYIDIFQTDQGVTNPGDSGGAVTTSGTSLVIGHVVGGIGLFSSFIQDVNYQLLELSIIPSMSNINL